MSNRRIIILFFIFFTFLKSINSTWSIQSEVQYNGDTSNIDLGTGWGGGDKLGDLGLLCKDINLDDKIDIIVGAPEDDVTGDKSGTVYILFMDSTTINTYVKISDLNGSLGDTTGDNSKLGKGLGDLDDLDDNGVPDIGIGSPGANAIYIVGLESDGTVKTYQLWDDTQFVLVAGDEFGMSSKRYPDLDSDGIDDIVVGAGKDATGGNDTGALYLVAVTASVGVKTYIKLSRTNGFSGIATGAKFGQSLDSIGGWNNDLDEDGVIDLVVGAPLGVGSVYIVFMASNLFTVKTYVQISNSKGSFTATVEDDFGYSVSHINEDEIHYGDIDGDNIQDIIAGEEKYGSAGNSYGAAYIIALKTTGNVKTWWRLDANVASVSISAADKFGTSCASFGKDVNGDGYIDIMIGGKDYDGPSGKNIMGGLWFFSINHPTINILPTFSPTMSPTPTPIVYVSQVEGGKCTDGLSSNICDTIEDGFSLASKLGIETIILYDETFYPQTPLSLGAHNTESGSITLETVDTTGDGAIIDCSDLDTAIPCITFGNFTSLTVTKVQMGKSSSGAVTFENGGTVAMNNCNFAYNTGVNGGALYGTDISAITLNDCQLFYNDVSNNGGAVYGTDSATYTFNRCVFTGNDAENNGGAVHVTSTGNVNFDDCTFDENTAVNNGGGIYIDESISTTFVTTDFSQNSANNGDNIFWATTAPSYDASTISSLANDSVASGYYLDLGTWVIDCGECKFNSGNVINASSTYPQVTLKNFDGTTLTSDDTSIVSVTGDPITSIYDYTLSSGTASLSNIYAYDGAGRYSIDIQITSSSSVPFNDYTITPRTSFDITIKPCKSTYYRDGSSFLCEKCDTPGEYAEGLESTECSACDLGYYCTGDGTRTECPAGSYGDETGLTDSACSGSCNAGFYCPVGSTSASEAECGGGDLYCPEGSGAPIAIPDGFCGVGLPNTRQTGIEACSFQLDSIDPTSGSTRGDYIITVYGSGLDNTTQQVWIGDNQCNLIPSPATDTVMYCEVQPGSGDDLAVTITSDSTSSTAGGPTFSYFSPNISKVEGCENIGDATINCPTKGEVTLTITGTDFTNDEDGISVFVGGSECTDLALITVHTKVQCTLPEGAGEDVSVQVVTQAGQSGSEDLLSYAGPTIYSVTGCNDTDIGWVANTTNACSRTDEELVLVTGKNFGPTGARVMIAGNLAGIVVDNNGEVNYHEKLWIRLPQASGTTLSVNLIQLGGQISDGIKLVSYRECAPGEYNVYDSDLDFWLCDDCPVGKISTDYEEYSCTDCPVNTYWSDGTSCTDCDDLYFGSESPVGSKNSSVCTCPTGFVVNVDSCDCPTGWGYDATDNICVQCGLGEYKETVGREACSSCDDVYTDSLTSNVGATLQSDCSCPTGFVVNGNSCDCPLGWGYDATETTCVQCGAGEYKQTIGRDSCSSCDVFRSGSTTDFVGATSQSNCSCPNNLVVNGDSCDCPAGYEYDATDNICSPCGIGEYKSNVSLDSCSSCDDIYSGAITEFTGSTLESDCTCPTGFVENGDSCDCPAGYGYDATENTCSPCGIDEYKIDISRDSCLLCDDLYSGSETRDVGATLESNCSCPDGFVLNGDSCDCPAGSGYDATENTCSPCGIGEYKVDISRDSCLLCNDLYSGSSTSNVGSTLESDCTCSSPSMLNGDSCDCPAGYGYDATEGICVQCGIGEYKVDINRDSCSSCNDLSPDSTTLNVGSTTPANCTCPDGFVLNGDSCDCPAGYGYDGTSIKCVACDLGRYKQGINRDSCSSCEDVVSDSSTGGVASTSSDDCQCPTGLIRTNDSCACNKGYEINGVDCTICPLGEYKDTIGGSGCLSCTDTILDSTTKFVGATSLANCTCPDTFILYDNECQCPPGTFYVPDEKKCEACPNDEWLNITSRRTSCNFCSDIRRDSVTVSTGTIDSIDCVCSSNYFLNLDFECERCPTGTLCDLPGNTIYTLPVLAGYWRVSDTSTDIIECPEENACEGTMNLYGDDDAITIANITFTAGCAKGYTGPYCFTCDDGYAKQLDGTCDKCDNAKIGESIIIIVVIGGLVILVIALLFWKMSQRRDRSAHQRWLEQSVTVWSRDDGKLTNKKAINRPGTAIETTKTKKAKKAARKVEVLRMLGGGPYHAYRTKFKILFAFFQMLTTIPTTFQVVYPEVFENFLDNLSIVNLDIVNIFSLDCFVSTDFYVELLGVTLIPLILTPIIWGWYVVQILTREYRAGGNSQFVAFSSTMSAFLTLTYVVFPTVSTKIFQLYICDDFDDGTSYMTYDLTVDCNTSKHTSYEGYGAFMIILYPIGIPLMYSILLWRNREALNPFMPGISDRQRMIERDRNDSVHFISFLYEPYKPDYYWYEVVECLRRLFFTSIAAFVLEGTSSQLAFGVLFALIFLGLYYYCIPYADKSDNFLSLISHWCLLLTLFGGLLIKVGTTENDSYDLYALGIALVVVNFFLLFLGVAGILSTTFLLYLEMKKKYPDLKPIDHINMMVRGEDIICELKGIERNREFDAVENGKKDFKWSSHKGQALSTKMDDDIGNILGESEESTEFKMSPHTSTVFKKEKRTTRTVDGAPGLGDFEMSFFGAKDNFGGTNPLHKT